MLRIRTEIQEEAEVIKLQGGEIPEIAFFESLNYLKEDGLEPTEDELFFLKQAVAERYKDIIRRDLDPANRSESMFRSPKRACINHRRLKDFADKAGIGVNEFQNEAGEMLAHYLKTEADAIQQGGDFNTLDMTMEETAGFLKELNCWNEAIEPLVRTVCSVETVDFNEAMKRFRP